MNRKLEKAKETLQLQSGSGSLGVAKLVWETALNSALEREQDKKVDIFHEPIPGGSADSRTHVAAIPTEVGCHFHKHKQKARLPGEDDEIYEVVSGKGTLHWGWTVPDPDSKNGYRVLWEKPVKVETGDSFVIPEDYAHQLRKRGRDPLVILFKCPDAHLDDNQNRTCLEGSPLTAGERFERVATKGLKATKKLKEVVQKVCIPRGNTF